MQHTYFVLFCAVSWIVDIFHVRISLLVWNCVWISCMCFWCKCHRSWFHHAQLQSLASSFVLMIHQEKERNALKIGAMNLGWGTRPPKYRRESLGIPGGSQGHCRVHRDGSLSNLCKSVVVSVSPAIAWLGPRTWKWSLRKRSRKKNSSKCLGHFCWQLKRYQRYRSNSRSRQEIWVIFHHFWVPFWVPTCDPDPNVST